MSDRYRGAAANGQAFARRSARDGDAFILKIHGLLLCDSVAEQRIWSIHLMQSQLLQLLLAQLLAQLFFYFRRQPLRDTGCTAWPALKLLGLFAKFFNLGL